MKFSFIQDLEAHLCKEHALENLDVTWELCPQDYEGEVTINCFRLAPTLRKSPEQIAQTVQEYLEQHPDVEQAICVKAFVNIVITAAPLFQETVADETQLLRDAKLPQEQQQRILIEFSAPNTNKPQHLGHVRNNALGQAITSIFRRVGHTVIPVNLVNDRGIHICQSMIAYQRWGNAATPESTGRKGDHFVGDFYVMFQQEQKRQLEELREQHPEFKDSPDEDLLLKTEIGQAAQNLLVAWEQGDPDVLRQWWTMHEWVMQGFEQTYARMGVEFDKVYFESETFHYGRQLVHEGLEKGLLEEHSDGAVFCNLEDEKLGHKIVLRKDGTSVYVTQDLGTTLIKQQEYEPDQQIWIVGDEQKHHFRVLFAILRKLGYTWADQLTHMPYGMIDLPSGKMKSREGTVVDADELFDEMADLARSETRKRTEGEDPEDLDQRSEMIGMAAVKFMLLSAKPTTRLTFDPDKAVRFEGDTGPYVQYACARISSILRKADETVDESAVCWNTLGTPEEKDLALQCALYGETLRRAAREQDTAAITAYLLNLAKSFSRFYRECSVLNASSPELRQARLALCARVRTLLTEGLSSLTIEPLESM